MGFSLMWFSLLIAGRAFGHSIDFAAFARETVQCYQGEDGKETLMNCTAGWCRIRVKMDRFILES
jgi:hypothetical protein